MYTSFITPHHAGIFTGKENKKQQQQQQQQKTFQAPSNLNNLVLSGQNRSSGFTL